MLFTRHFHGTHPVDYSRALCSGPSVCRRRETMGSLTARARPLLRAPQTLGAHTYTYFTGERVVEGDVLRRRRCVQPFLTARRSPHLLSGVREMLTIALFVVRHLPLAAARSRNASQLSKEETTLFPVNGSPPFMVFATRERLIRRPEN